MAGMGTKELREKYEASGTKQAINRAIRAELVGGDLVLDGMTRFRDLVRTGGSNEAGEALEVLREIAAQMEAEIRRRYDLPPMD
jgi:hypothetical protein